MPTQIAGYRIVSEIGRGGMSTVYLGEHLHLKRRVAVKVLAPELGESRSFRERFARESQTVAALEHPHIVPIFDAGDADGLLYIVMRYIEHRDLRALLDREGPLPAQRAVRLVQQLADALEVAHAAELVHRDIKPANVLMGTDRTGADHCFLTDFGITKRAASGPSLTGTGQVLGTVDYISPEQVDGGQVDARTDVYALAGLLFHCLTGRVPFERDHQLAVLLAHLKEPPRPVTSLVPDLPRAIDDVITTAMAKDPARRPASAAEFAARAAAALGVTEGVAAPAVAGWSGSTTRIPPAAPRPAASHPAASHAGSSHPGASHPGASHPGASPVAASHPAAPHPVAASHSAGSQATIHTAAGPPPATAPQRAATARSGRRRWPLVLTGAAALVAATVTAVVLLVGGSTPPAAAGDTGPAAPTEARARAAAPPRPELDRRAEAAALLRSVAPQAGQSCTEATPVGTALAALSCPVGDVVVTYTGYADATASATAFDAAAAGAGAVPGRCGSDARAWTTGYHRADPAVATGRLACWQPADGAHLVWTQADLPTVVASAVVPGGAQVHHDAYDRWAADEFGPVSGAPAPRRGCSAGEC